MCIAEYLTQRANEMGPNESLTIDRGWIEWLLEAHTCGCGGSVSDTAVGNPASLHGYAPQELANLFGNAPSTIRGWCALGVFGDPTTLKPNGRDWHVPLNRVEALQSRLAEGYQITSEGLCAPEDSIATAGDDPTTPPAPPPAKGRSETRPPSNTRRQRRDEHRRYNGWRHHVS